MSTLLINQYYQNLNRTLQYGKSTNEQAIRNHFWFLLNSYAREFNYEVVPEVPVMGTKGKKVYPDGTVKNLWGLNIGLWESKDEKDDISAEIDAKIKKGYPLTNILFEDSKIAYLYQRGEEVAHASIREPDKLHSLLKDFFTFKSEIVYKFEEAIERFKADIPIIVDTLRNKIIEARENNDQFLRAQGLFLDLCKEEINPEVTIEDVREMLIQHLLTSDIFNKIFDDPEFHNHNTIAVELEKLISILFTYTERRNLLFSIENYYEAINATAAGITDHHEKQKFLKVLYENFYRVYNPKAAEKLGVVYTPNEIVNFMVQSTDYLLHKHFGKAFADKNVEILDPATGTGTFLTSIIDYIPKKDLAYKYQNEIYANEVAILPYYIANLNVEYTFKQKMQYYQEFTNICFVDTLDNTASLAYSGKEHELFAISSENSERIKRQNSKRISVIIGNPPYYANQANFNDFNKKRVYPIVDKRIKDTFVKQSNATNKANLYDMYTRFYRWAMDRIDKNGVICFITNHSFIHKKAFDGFRRTVEQEFDYAYIVDLGGDIRTLSGKDGIWMNEEHTIFGKSAAVGIAIMILIKKEIPENATCRIQYIHPCDIRALRTEKLEWLKNNPIHSLNFTTILPGGQGNWINQTKTDFQSLMPLIDKNLKAGKLGHAIFKIYSLGIATHRDDWVYDFDEKSLTNKIQYFIDIYNHTIDDGDYPEKKSIAWDRELENYRGRKIKNSFEREKIVKSLFRPFIKKYHYFDRHLIGMQYQFGNLHKLGETNLIIAVNREGNSKPFHVLGSDSIIDLHTTGDSQCLPLFVFDSGGNKINNITDWALTQFGEFYKDQNITKESIFLYVYSVLHDPAYKVKYEQDLKENLPRIPLYKDFWLWANWGHRLMDLHINYEFAIPYPLREKSREVKSLPETQKEIYSIAAEPQAMFAHKPKIKV